LGKQKENFPRQEQFVLGGFRRKVNGEGCRDGPEGRDIEQGKWGRGSGERKPQDHFEFARRKTERTD